MDAITQATQPTQVASEHMEDLLANTQVSACTICRLICTTNQMPNIDLKPKEGLKEWYFGRNVQCDISYSKTTRISNKHFKIWCSDSNTLIQDLSTNGTYINNQRIVKGQNYILSQGDEIAVGIGIAKDVVRFIVFFPKPLTSESPSLDQDGIHKEFIIKDEVVGQGAFAIVKKAVERSTGKTFAVKIISKRKIMGNTDGVTRELEILRRLDHPGIVKLRGFFEDDDNYYLVMEFVPGGDLMDFVAAHGSVGEEAAKEITKQILKAISYVHSQQISHRDLKPDNILIAQDDPVLVKITDFGLAKISNTKTFMKTFCGTLAYVAPEIIDGRFAIDNDKYSSLVDMWSLGCLVYVILTAHLPFSGSTQDQLYKQIKQGSYHEPPLKEAGISLEARNFLDSLLQVDPRRRLSAKNALLHPWILSNSQNSQISLSQSQSQQMRLENENKFQLTEMNEKIKQEESINEPVFKVPAPPKPSQVPNSQLLNKKLNIKDEFNKTSVIEESQSQTDSQINSSPIKSNNNQHPKGTSYSLIPTASSKIKSGIFTTTINVQHQNPFIIGRNLLSNFKIKEDRISKIHCALIKKRHPVGNNSPENKQISKNISIYESPAQGLEDIWLLDFSTNGCYINGIKIGKGKKVLIYNNDEVMLFNDLNKEEHLKFKVNIVDGTGIFNNGELLNKDSKRLISNQDEFDSLIIPKIKVESITSEKRKMEDSQGRTVKRAALDKGDANSTFQSVLR